MPEVVCASLICPVQKKNTSQYYCFLVVILRSNAWFHKEAVLVVLVLCDADTIPSCTANNTVERRELLFNVVSEVS